MLAEILLTNQTHWTYFERRGGDRLREDDGSDRTKLTVTAGMTEVFGGRKEMTLGQGCWGAGQSGGKAFRR